MTLYDKGFYTILGVSALFVALALPLALRRIPRNAVYGYRTRATMADDETWYDANAWFGWSLVASSVGGAFVAWAIHLARPFSPETFLPVSVALLAAPALVAAIATALHLRRSTS